jgi:AcrR family transcriptional regulator
MSITTPTPTLAKPGSQIQFAPRTSARDKLIHAAMRAFGERGASVPMVEISTAAGNRNKSAVTYHFEGRSGLIDAVYNEISSFLEPRFDALLRQLEAKPAAELSLYEIVLALNSPFFALYASEPNGVAALKSLARLGNDSPPGDESMYRLFLSATFGRFAALIIKTTPRKPMGQLRFHLAHYLLATVNGLAAVERWREVEFRSEPELMFELLLSYADYVSGGVASTEFERPPFDADSWRQAIKP